MLVEYGKLDMDFNKGMMVISCTAPIDIIEKLSKIQDHDLKLIIDKKCRAFVDVPEDLFEEGLKN